MRKFTNSIQNNGVKYFTNVNESVCTHILHEDKQVETSDVDILKQHTDSFLNHDDWLTAAEADSLWWFL